MIFTKALFVMFMKDKIWVKRFSTKSNALTPPFMRAKHYGKENGRNVSLSTPQRKIPLNSIPNLVIPSCISNPSRPNFLTLNIASCDEPYRLSQVLSHANECYFYSKWIEEVGQVFYHWVLACMLSFKNDGLEFHGRLFHRSQ